MNIAVIGGGAAGFFSAVNTAEKNPDARIILFEAASKPLQKVFISGGGRCNLTHHCFDIHELASRYPRGSKALLSLFSRFQPKDTMHWFETRGLPLKTEADGRVFPISDSSQDVIDLLMKLTRKHGIQQLFRQRIQTIARQGNAFLIRTADAEYLVDAVILATGYSPTGWALAQTLGHTVIPPVPSLFPFKSADPVIANLQGVSLPDVIGKIQTNAMKKPMVAQGDLLITHTGVSGPVIYRLSAKAARDLVTSNYQALLTLDLMPGQSEEEIRQSLQSFFQEENRQKKISNTRYGVPQRLWIALLENAEVSLEKRGVDVSRADINRIADRLKRLPLPIQGKSPSKEEFVSCGGVRLSEVNFQTMESRLCPGLYFAGEILDIDGLTGGFNFQACWSEGWVISEALRAV